MEKSIFEQIGATFRQEGDYLIPNLTAPKYISVGIWGQRRRHYLRTQRRALYNALLLSGKLDDHLVEVNTQAETMFFQLVEQLSEQEGITEQLKTENQMEWVRRMNNIRSRTEEVVYSELIYI